MQPVPCHHACGFKLANEGHDTRPLQHYLGHKNIAHTVRYTDLAPDRFKFKDSGETELITPKTGRSGADWLDPHHRLEGEVVTRWSLKISGW